MMLWTHAGPSVLAAFLASLVEFVEALTIVLAVGTVRGWRSALTGVAGGVVLLAVMIIAFGPLLGQIPIKLLQIFVGMLLLLFGMRWLRKAILRSAGAIGLHDEQAAFDAETAQLRATSVKAATTLDPLAVATAFKAVLLEGIEVVFIVIAVGATANMLVPASVGAALAGVLVIALGIVLQKPLARIPENTLKFAVGVLISAFGIFWVGEGFGLVWPGEDLAILALAVALLIVALASVKLARHRLQSMEVAS
ncbi:COG4280 domain-containing protein [Pollutimonas bauzanensis]|uniref:Uncharacterized membrane protein n=1 Tax=Pollutimonas bauzanensis TaxID=658167 RepID=A0A1M6AS86_9BURK|nr:TMEM165/GDT1 family protein [Pollutimonas bauzanensis]SHI06008.1 Uncharacterized membrane protein [Pollutimonas bauzanensis]SHI39374.1 Uncharacterized membrane protein [Pollutimonas bauzanensis]